MFYNGFIMLESLKKIGYTGDDNLSLMIDWIRENKNFYIWIEHGVLKRGGTKTHDLTISGGGGFGGCLRGSYLKYTDAQKKGLEIFINFHNKNCL